MLRSHTHRQSKEQGLYTCTPKASIFVCFFLKVHHPPLESSESHAGGAALGECQRGEAPGPGLESPIATQSQAEDQPRPEQQRSRAEGRRQLETHRSSTRHIKTTQILFHFKTCVATSEWTPSNQVLNAVP
ncbi:unnamed protein product [Pleuronectes platessa]|uniref:Uncharacterized protein n=1 Tax=Pleuronectes platessa TaxID=8262 RepID=A0A9N7VG54_PLEPL|nr:unnamed protein product [Pleuronectes platessa]